LVLLLITVRCTRWSRAALRKNKKSHLRRISMVYLVWEKQPYFYMVVIFRFL
jgi:hypothetical protein